MSENNGKPVLHRNIDFHALRKTKTVHPPGLDYSVILRKISVAEWLSLGNDGVQQLAYSIVDEQGARIFTSDEDMKNLAEMPADVGKFLIFEMMELNGISKTAVDESLKNSEAGRNTAFASV